MLTVILLKQLVGQVDCPLFSKWSPCIDMRVDVIARSGAAGCKQDVNTLCYVMEGSSQPRISVRPHACSIFLSRSSRLLKVLLAS